MKRWGLLLLVPALLVGCKDLFDLDLRYQDCVAPEVNWLSEFDGNLQEIKDRCWNTDSPSDAGADEITVLEGDLIISPSRGTDWTRGTPGPMLYRDLSGDFSIGVRVESLGSGKPDHCLAENALAGLVVQSRKRDRFAALLLGPDPRSGPGCIEDAEPPARTRLEVWARSSEGGAVKRGALKRGVGEDGEAEIVICRYRDEVRFYHCSATADMCRTLDAGAGQRWEEINIDPAGGGTLGDGGNDVSPDPVLRIGFGEVRVGLTASGSRVTGHFDTLALSTGKVSDDCRNSLTRLKLPESQ